MSDNIVRITVVGDGYTGKTCLLIVYKDKTYSDNYIPTVFDSYSMTINVAGKDYLVILSDTAGQEDYQKLRPLAYNETDVFIICYSVDSKDSYANVKQWSKEVKYYRPHCKIILVATKIDVRDTPKKGTKYLNFEDGLRMKKDIKAHDFIECSSMKLYNVNKVFESALLSTIVLPPERKRVSTCNIL